MNKIDCVTELMEEAIEANRIEIAIKFLDENYPIDKVYKAVEIPIFKLKKEYKKYLEEKHDKSCIT